MFGVSDRKPTMAMCFGSPSAELTKPRIMPSAPVAPGWRQRTGWVSWHRRPSSDCSPPASAVRTCCRKTTTLHRPHGVFRNFSRRRSSKFKFQHVTGQFGNFHIDIDSGCFTARPRTGFCGSSSAKLIPWFGAEKTSNGRLLVTGVPRASSTSWGPSMLAGIGLVITGCASGESLGPIGARQRCRRSVHQRLQNDVSIDMGA